jgi:hypothetical protein
MTATAAPDPTARAAKRMVGIAGLVFVVIGFLNIPSAAWADAPDESGASATKLLDCSFGSHRLLWRQPFLPPSGTATSSRSMRR